MHIEGILIYGRMYLYATLESLHRIEASLAQPGWLQWLEISDRSQSILSRQVTYIPGQGRVKRMASAAAGMARL